MKIIKSSYRQFLYVREFLFALPFIIRYFRVRSLLLYVINGFHFLPKKERVISAKNGIMVNVRPGSSDWWEMFSILSGAEYVKLEDFLPPGLNNTSLVIVDAGANIGLFSIYVNKLFLVNKLILIEPDADNLRMMKSNIALNKSILGAANIKVIEDALYQKDGDVCFNNLGRHNMCRISESGNLRVKAISIKNLFNINNLEYVDIMKIDIEGGEWNLLTIENEQYFKVVHFLIIEYHLNFNNTDNDNVTLRNYFENIGFTVVNQVEKNHIRQGIYYFKQGI